MLSRNIKIYLFFDERESRSDWWVEFIRYLIWKQKRRNVIHRVKKWTQIKRKTENNKWIFCHFTLLLYWQLLCVNYNSSSKNRSRDFSATNFSATDVCPTDVCPTFTLRRWDKSCATVKTNLYKQELLYKFYVTSVSMATWICKTLTLPCPVFATQLYPGPNKPYRKKQWDFYRGKS